MISLLPWSTSSHPWSTSDHVRFFKPPFLPPLSRFFLSFLPPPSLPPLLASSLSSYLPPFVVAAAQEKGDAESKKREAEEASAKYAENRCVLAAQERANPCIEKYGVPAYVTKIASYITPGDSGLLGRVRENFVRSEMQGRGQVHCHALHWPGSALMEEATISDDQVAMKNNK